MDKMDCQIQILAIDLLDTLFKTNKKISKIDFKKYFDKNAKNIRWDNGQFNQDFRLTFCNCFL